MEITSLFLDAPDQMVQSHLVRDEHAAVNVLRELYPEATRGCPDADVVHRLSQDGIRARIQQHDVSWLTRNPVVPASTYGDLYRVSTFAWGNDARRGEFLRPATATEAALSLSCAQYDGGAGIFGARSAPSQENDLPGAPLDGPSPSAGSSTTSGEATGERPFKGGPASSVVLGTALPLADSGSSGPGSGTAMDLPSWMDGGVRLLHYASAGWASALTSSSVRYYRVEKIPAGAVLPAVPAELLPSGPGI